LASRSFDNQKQKYQQDDQKKVNEEEKKLAKAEGIALSIPGSLQTVLENLPLVYNADDKSLQQSAIHETIQPYLVSFVSETEIMGRIVALRVGKK
uniref:DUF3340 domain-containing protein n=1 Tax=Elaeophora elaphi TaxID=1147741 RepID=A0A0R3RNJ7_9BILA